MQVAPSSFLNLRAGLSPPRRWGKGKRGLRRVPFSIEVILDEAGSESALFVTLRLTVGRKPFIQRVREDDLHSWHYDLRRLQRLTISTKELPHIYVFLQPDSHKCVEVCSWYNLSILVAVIARGTQPSTHRMKAYNDRLSSSMLIGVGVIHSAPSMG
jgi:hypothetical protein